MDMFFRISAPGRLWSSHIVRSFLLYGSAPGVRGMLKKFYSNGTKCSIIALQECNASGELRDLYGSAT